MRAKLLLPLLLTSIAPLAAAPLAPSKIAPRPTPFPAQHVTPPAQKFGDRYARFNSERPIVLAPIRAQAWVLMDAQSGRVLASHRATQRMFPASTTKTMTALVAIRHGDLKSVVTIGVNPAKTGESSIYLMAGEKFALGDLVRAAMIKSANDSCVAIAEAVAGTTPQFVKMMNKTAREIGATGTNFVNPHGLHDAKHYTTALDLARIGRAAMKEPFFRKVSATRETEIHGNWKLGPRRPLLNRNRLLFRWAQCDGIKTGYTRQAGNCLISSATRLDARGRPWRLIGVVLKSPDSWSDSYNLLVHEGFEKFQPQVIARKGESAGEFSLADGATGGRAVVSRDAIAPLRPEENDALERRVKWNVPRAPIALGARVGTWEIRAAGQLIDTIPLVSDTAVAAALTSDTRTAPRLPDDDWQRWGGLAALGIGAVLLIAALKMSRR